jgi:hypothetical protein
MRNNETLSVFIFESAPWWTVTRILNIYRIEYCIFGGIRKRKQEKSNSSYHQLHIHDSNDTGSSQQVTPRHKRCEERLLSSV